MVRTKSGRLIEKTILMTEEEFKAFQESGGDMNMLKKYLKLGKDDVIENWEKASTVYSASDDEAVAKGWNCILSMSSCHFGICHSIMLMSLQQFLEPELWGKMAKCMKLWSIQSQGRSIKSQLISIPSLLKSHALTPCIPWLLPEKLV